MSLEEKYKQEILLLLKEKPRKFWELAGICEVPFENYVKIINEFLDKGYIAIDSSKNIIIAEKGKELVKDFDLKDFRCKICKGRGFLEFKEIEEIFKEIAKDRPKPIGEFDQGYQTINSNLARLAFMYSYGDVKGKEIIVLGDDDLMSICLALAKAKYVVAIDIDDRLVRFIDEKAKEYGLSIETLKLDLKNPLPDDFIERFDVFVTDPLETATGFKIMVGRGIAAIKVGSAGYFGLTLIDCSLKDWHAFEKIILDCNAVIASAIPLFSYYEVWEYTKERGECYKLSDEEKLFIAQQVEQSWLSIPRELRQLASEPWYTSTLFRVVKIGEFNWNEKV